jgi:hypothetical protein
MNYNEHAIPPNCVSVLMKPMEGASEGNKCSAGPWQEKAWDLHFVDICYSLKLSCHDTMRLVFWEEKSCDPLIMYLCTNPHGDILEVSKLLGN